MCVIMYLHIYIYMYIWPWIKTRVVVGPPSSVTNLCRGPLLQTLVADLCVEYCSLQGACRGGACRRTRPSVTNLCREIAAQACYKANVFDSLAYIYIYMHILVATHVCTDIYVYVCIHVCNRLSAKPHRAAGSAA